MAGIVKNQHRCESENHVDDVHILDRGRIPGRARLFFEN